LDRAQIWLLALISAAMWLVSEDGMLIILALVLAFRAYTKREVPPESDWAGFAQFSGLIVAFSLLCLIRLPQRL
jgi:ABC-type polysaccharide transport system permease subunit